MKAKLLCGSTLFLLIATMTALAQEVDQETATIKSDASALSLSAAPNADCTLSVPPVVFGGTQFTASVNYHIPVPFGDREEKFEFNWPSKVDSFGEQTVRIKSFTPGTALSGGSSFESVSVPRATNIHGTFTAVVKVKGTVRCKATAEMTVISR